MPEPVINVYTLLVVPLGERMQQDPRFRDVKNIIYDTDEIAFDQMPAIEYYVDSPWTDNQRGTGAYSLQTRRLVTRIAFTIWIFDAKSRARMDHALFQISGLLLDFLHDNTEFDRTNGVLIDMSVPLTWEVIRPGTEAGFVGVNRVIAQFHIYSGTGL